MMSGLMPVELLKFLKSQPSPAKVWQGQDKDPYFEALKLYWSGKKTEALNAASDAIASDDESPLRFAFYRLWIQVVSDLGETLSLHSLRDHLLLVGQADKEGHESYMALRGVIHLVLDQVEAAQLLSRGVEGGTENPYVLEFLDSLDAQTKEEQRPRNSPSRILDCKSQVRDWFHWQSIVRSVIRHGQDDLSWKQVRTVSQFVTQLFPFSPIEADCDLHRSLETGRFADAFIYASKLAKMYPLNSDYVFYRAFARMKCGEPRAALEIIESSLVEHVGRDADLTLLRGTCLAELSKKNGGEAMAVKAKKVLEDAIRISRTEGMPTQAATSLLAEINEILKSESDEPDHAQSFRPTRIWFAKVSPEQFHELRSAPESEIEQLNRAMGDQPQPGDLCFFAGEGPTYNPKGNPGWRIAAVYSVTAPPAWHPSVRFQSSLQLLSRPEFSIPVDMQILDEEVRANRDTPRNHPIRSGVFEVEMGALDVITEIIRSRSEGSAKSITNYLDSMSGMRRSV